MLTVVVLDFFFFPCSGQLPSVYRGRKSKSAITVRYYKWIVLIVLEILWVFSPCNFCLENKIGYKKECYLKPVLFAVSKYLTLLIEIHPINNVKVLKAVDSCVRVQVNYSTNLIINLLNSLC